MNCQNCGQDNDYGANFCRYCGTRIVLNQPANQPQTDNNSYSQPRPYAWKTDEFQITDARRTQQIPQVQPQPNQTTQLNKQNNLAYQQPNYPQPTYQPPQPLVYQPQHLAAQGYRCPRCGNQNAPLFVRKISTAGWVVFAVLLALTGILFWIGLLIKEDARVCPICNFRVS